MRVYDNMFQDIPSGYERKLDETTGTEYYENVFTGVRWFSSQDTASRVYFFREDGSESCWQLPSVAATIQDRAETVPSPASTISNNYCPNTSPLIPTHYSGSKPFSYDLSPPPAIFSMKNTQKNLIPSNSGVTAHVPRINVPPLPISTPNVTIKDVSIVVVKQGPLNKTKLVEHGKKYRKNWSTGHVVLTDMFLLVFKDAKSFAAMQQSSSGPSSGHHLPPEQHRHQKPPPADKPEVCIDLKGSAVDWTTGGDKVSSRRNVFQIRDILGTRLLLQDDNHQTALEWFEEIRSVVGSADFSTRTRLESTSNSSGMGSRTSTLQNPKKPPGKISRSKSLRLKLMGSNEDLSSANVNTDHSPGSPPPTQSKIKERLKKFFLRRPAMDDLFRRGIIRNEPVFGSTLLELASSEQQSDGVPIFLARCIETIERNPEHLATDGIYRQSGNLAHVQKIRCAVDQGQYHCLDSVDDIHVLTGALKLFFRELREPLIPWNHFQLLLKASTIASRKNKIKQIRSIISSMPSPHKYTLKFLLHHLLKVTEFQEKNRMQIANMAIVFGPTLMWPPPSLVSNNLALDMMQQNIVIECLLQNTKDIF